MIKEKDKKTVVGILKKVYDAGGEPAVIAFCDSKGKDMPAIKLTDKELGLLNGGTLESSDYWGIGVGIVFVGTCCAIT